VNFVLVNRPSRRPQQTPRPHRPRRLTVPILVVLLAVNACTSTEPSADTEPGATVATAPPTATPLSNQPPASQPTTEEPNVPTVRITIADQTITAQLADNPTAQDLIDQLPLTLTFQDFNRVEKVAQLPRPPNHGRRPRRRRP
jgi:Cyclophilin-like family